MENLPSAWLCNYTDDTLSIKDLTENLQALWNCDWNPALHHPFVRDAMLHIFKNKNLPTNLPPTDIILWLAISSLQAFVQENFLGPPLVDNVSQTLPYTDILLTIENIADTLIVDGESLNVNVSRSELLALANFLLKLIIDADHFDKSYVVQVWYMRCLYVYQQILDEPSSTLYAEFVRISDLCLTKIESIECFETKASILLEICQTYVHYRRITHAEQHLKAAKSLLHIQLNVEGLMGKRTKFQQKSLPQMVLRVNCEADETVMLPASISTHRTTTLPMLLALNDDLRLERITFENETDNNVFEMPSLIQALLLTQIKFIQRSQPKDKLADEELQPYMTTMLYQEHGPWPVRIAVLLDNVQLESTHKRTVDRSLKQCEQILTQIESADGDISQRFSFAYASFMRPRWTIKVLFGNLMISLGLIKSALDLFLRIQKWTDVIACYTVLELRHKAAEIIEQELAKKPTVELYCLLGDATDDPALYEKAWQLSGERSGRAQRHWGCYHFARKEYAEAIPHLERSLAINSLQETVWARLGFAAIELEQWSLAANAYRRYTTIEPNGFECWNNLAKAYIHMGDKPKAHKVLHEALRCNFDNWKVWENFLIVSIDTGHFEDGINAYNRLLELKGKYYDKEILSILVNTVAGDVADAVGRPTRERLTKKLQTLIGHVGVQQPADGVVWEMAAQLATKDQLVRAQKLQKAYRCYTQMQVGAYGTWSKSSESSEKVLTVCVKLCDASLEAFGGCKDTDRVSALSQLSSARLSAQAAVRAATDANWDNCMPLVDELSARLDRIKAILVQSQ